MTEITRLPLTRWDQPASPELQAQAVQALESGHVLLLPELVFPLHESERGVLSTTTAGAGKNVSLNPADGRLRGSSATAAERVPLRSVMERFASSSRAVMDQLFPGYAPTLEVGRTSFRPVEIAGRPTSWRKDDTRLHVDSFPSSPTHGKRILRLFTNLNPHGQPRVWRLGEPFEQVARRFLPSLHRPLWGTAALLKTLRVTKGLRSPYDHYMLQMHDRMKADTRYQQSVAQITHGFEPGCTWLVYTDQASHAAMSGQYALEQTFYLPVHGMQTPAKSPLKVLERLLNRPLL